MFERILLAVDGSKTTEYIVPYTGLLAKTLKSKLFLLCARKGPVAEHEDYLEEKARELSSTFGPLEIRTAEIVAGEPSSGIINYAEQHKVSLVVMASHSKSGILFWPIGSMAVDVLRGITMPLLGIKSTGAKITPDCVLCNRILVPLDGSKACAATLPYAAELCRQLKTPLTLFRMVEPSLRVRTVGGLQSFNLLPEQVKRHMNEARAYLEDVRKSLKDVEDVSIEVRKGMAVRDLIKYADEFGADLIAMSTHGYHQNKEGFGSVFYKVLQSGRTHILAVRPPI